MFGFTRILFVHSDKNERLWVWKGGDEEGNDLPLDLGEVIRFRVSNVIFQEQEKDSLNSVRIRTKDNGHEESMDMSWDKDGEIFMGTSGNFAPMVVMVRKYNYKWLIAYL